MVKIRQNPKFIWIARGLFMVGAIICIISLLIDASYSLMNMAVIGTIVMTAGTFYSAKGVSLSISESQVRYGTKKFDIATTEFLVSEDGVQIDVGGNSRIYQLKQSDYHPDDWEKFVALIVLGYQA